MSLLNEVVAAATSSGRGCGGGGGGGGLGHGRDCGGGPRQGHHHTLVPMLSLRQLHIPIVITK